MKKILALLLAAVMLLATLPVLAEEEEPKVYDLPEYGMKLPLPKAFKDAVYTASLNDNGVISHDPFVSVMLVTYYAIPNGTLNERYAAIDENDSEAMENFYKLQTSLGIILVTNAGSVEDAISAIAGELTDDMVVTEFGAVDDYHYYYISPDNYDDFLSAIADQEDPEKVRADMDLVTNGLMETLQAAEKYTPVDTLTAAIGMTIDYETTDLDGNAINITDLFKDNKVTMVNFWGTWCPHCVNEMPELAQIHTRLQEKGCGIVGIEYEQGAALESYKDDALALMEQCGTNYPNVLAPETSYVFVSGYPCTVFVDSEGKILTYPVLGPQVDQYETIIDSILSGEDMTGAVEPAENISGDGEYRIIVTDGEKPVEGVAVQFCDDTTCQVQMTNENGVATFRPEKPNDYDVHILKVPDGYAEDTQSYKTEDTWSELTITLQKAE